MEKGLPRYVTLCRFEDKCFFFYEYLVSVYGKERNDKSLDIWMQKNTMNEKLYVQ